jgi:hypothetical protein
MSNYLDEASKRFSAWLESADPQEVLNEYLSFELDEGPTIDEMLCLLEAPLQYYWLNERIEVPAVTEYSSAALPPAEPFCLNPANDETYALAA